MTKPYIKNIYSDDFFFHIETRTNINVLRSIQNITLHTRNLQFNNYTRLIKSNGAIYELNNFIHNYEKYFTVFDFNNVILPGFYTLKTAFVSNIIGDNAEGFFRSSYIDGNMK